MRSRVWIATLGRPRNARLTVATDTPAVAATSSIVARSRRIVCREAGISSSSLVHRGGAPNILSAVRSRRRPARMGVAMNAELARRAITLLYLTDLSDDCTAGDIDSLCERAARYGT